ncbi:MAG: MBL fold metallo-hydrolase [Deltaproteobacteria bacterium]|nr:MBL fold metallo-hydrolase [Deltaproteobacteria bacterium]
MTARRVFRIFAGLVLLVIVAFAALFASVFVGNRKLEDGAVLNGHALTVNDGYVGIFLLPAGEGTYAIIDCGNDREGKAIRAALEKRGATVDAVRAVFLTHGHPDHIAGCVAFAKADVYAFEADAPLAAGSIAAKSPMGKLAGKQTAKTATVTKFLKDGETVTVGDLQVRAFAIPGHTAGAAALLAKDVLYVGDSLTSKPDGAITDPPWIFTDDLAENRRSMIALYDRLQKESVPVKTIAFSHTGALEGTAALGEYVRRVR